MRAILIFRSRSSHEPDLACSNQLRRELESDVINRTGNAIRKTLVAMIAAAMIAAAIAPAMAGAQVTSPSCEQYSSSTGQFGGGNGSVVGGGKCNNVEPGGGGGSTNPPATSSGLNSRVGGLPFTGFDVLSMAAVALAVTGLGLILQRAVSRPREEL